jgi:hypothetical protein
LHGQILPTALDANTPAVILLSNAMEKQAHVFVAYMLLLGCAEDDATTDVVDGDAGADEPANELPCDIPKLFAERCSGSSCHGNGGTVAADLDLISPNVEERVSGAPGSGCMGVLADPANPEASLLYTKLLETPNCGARMPLAGQPLEADELLCMRDWISGLLPPTGDEGCENCLCEPGLTEDCYFGPAGTAGVGVCVGGTHTCQTSGMGWSVCEGEVGPRGENCFTPEIDENCDGSMPACTEAWALSFGNELTQSTRSVGLDADGNVYAFGDFEGVVSFGGDPLVATLDKGDLVLSKHDKYGNPLWSLRAGDSSNQYGEKLVVDADGNVILLARIYGMVDLGGGLLDTNGAGDMMVAKLDSNGQHVWSRMFGDKDPQRAERLVVDEQGDVYLTGTFTTKIDFGGGTFTTAGLRDAFVTKLDGATGQHLFSLQIGGPGDDYGFGIDLDGQGNIVIGGRFQDTIELGSPLVSEGGKDIYLAKLSPFGVVQWSRRFGGEQDDELHDLRVQDDTGDIVLVGAMSDTFSFGGAELISAGLRDIFLAKLDAEGNHIWSSRHGDELDQFSHLFELNTWLTLALEPDGTIHVGGSLIGTVDFGGPSLASVGPNPDAWHLRLGSDGTYLGGSRHGGTASEMVLDIAVAESGHVVMAGRAQGGALDFGVSGTVPTYGGADGFIVKLPPG